MATTSSTPNSDLTGVLVRVRDTGSVGTINTPASDRDEPEGKGGTKMSDNGAVTREPEPKLTAEAEKAVRTYLWRCLGPTSIVCVIVAGVLGYVIRDVAEVRARHDALSKVQEDVRAMAKAVGAAEKQVDFYSKSIKTLEDRAKEFDGKVTDLENRATLAIERLTEPDQLRKIADALAADPRAIKAFQEAAKGLDTAVSGLRDELNKLRVSLQMDCREGEVPTSETDRRRFEFNFPVKHAWIEFAGSGELYSQLLKTDIRGNVVTLRLEGTQEQPGEHVRCRVCATAF